VDGSSEHFENHIASVKKILEELNLSEIPRLLVFNKADLLDEGELEILRRAYSAVVISAFDRTSLMPMIERLGEMLDERAALRESKREVKAVAPARSNR
jgi:GTP-binding protein HflX